MLGGLLFGIAFAVGHHFFYNSLNGKAVSDNESTVLGNGLSQQQMSLAGGSAFALLARASLVYAVTVAFVQLFWKDVTDARRTPVATFSRLDNISHATNNLLVLLKVPLWPRYWFLLLVAMTTWY